MEKNKEILLEIKNLKQYFNEGKRNEVRAIEDISFNIYRRIWMWKVYNWKSHY